MSVFYNSIYFSSAMPLSSFFAAKPIIGGCSVAKSSITRLFKSLPSTRAKLCVKASNSQLSSHCWTCALLHPVHDPGADNRFSAWWGLGWCFQRLHSSREPRDVCRLHANA